MKVSNVLMQNWDIQRKIYKYNRTIHISSKYQVVNLIIILLIRSNITIKRKTVLIFVKLQCNSIKNTFLEFNPIQLLERGGKLRETE